MHKPQWRNIYHVPGSKSYKTEVCTSSCYLPRLNSLSGFDSTYLFAACIIFPKMQDPECIHFTQNHAIILTYFFIFLGEDRREIWKYTRNSHEVKRLIINQSQILTEKRQPSGFYETHLKSKIRRKLCVCFYTYRWVHLKKKKFLKNILQQ